MKLKSYILTGVIITLTITSFFIGRSYEMAPDIDGCIYVKGNGAKKDQFCKVKIEKALEYDLVGVVCNESCK